ncbi:Hypothetical predicted protein [Lecanosticta acicola]|uniref:Uncharacterized protein n=1 Tax=Lecanosticta acicola TaxID=111012 RepID=A0AAI9EE35_9PEZI|nr:Hypothetical predicted protein [Lecanosticta acicola]
MSKPRPCFKQSKKAGVAASPPAIEPKQAVPSAKKSVSINAMFDYGKALKRKLEPEADGMVRPGSPVMHSIPQPGYFQHAGQTKRQKNTPKPAFFQPETASGICADPLPPTSTAGAYRRFGEAQAAEEAALKERHRLEWTARANGLDLNGKPLQRPHIPTEEEIEALEAEIEDVNRNFEDEVVEINNGKMIQHARVGDTLGLYCQLHERKARSIAETEKLMRKLGKKIEEALKDLEDNEEIKKANEEYEAQCAALEQEKAKVEQQAERAKEMLRKEEREEAREFNRRLQALFEG